MTNGRVVNCAHPSQSVCPDKIISNTDKSLSGYGVQLVNETLQAGLQGGNKLIRNVAGFAFRQMMESLQFSPDIKKQCLLLLGAMPALAGTQPIDTSLSFTDPTNLTTTSEPIPFDKSEGPALLFLIVGIPALVGLCAAYAYCSDFHNEYQRFKDQNPHASRRQLIKAAFDNPNDPERNRYLTYEEKYRLPVPPAQRAPASTAPTTCEQATQTACEQGIQTDPVINDSPLQEIQPPTYAEATANLENPKEPVT
ncbi:hypothetical protein [Endozoicomonas sp. GU-1]|nr:hypothetical protein [Endozoicomonas sp. GU-1]WBA82645.1 hypothetical protein O2T12_05755 [Endozoicomonas sp. GU-1]